MSTDEIDPVAGMQVQWPENLFKTGAYSDLTIICDDCRYQVHKAVICTESDFFKAAVNGNFKEAQTGEINLPDDDRLAVRMMLAYMYTGNYAATDFRPLYNDKSKKRNLVKDPISSENKRLKMLDGQPQAISVSTSTPQMTPPSLPGSRGRGGNYRGARAMGRGASGRGRGGRGARSSGPPPQLAPSPASIAPARPPANFILHARVYALGEKYGIPNLKKLAVAKFKFEVPHHCYSAMFLAVVQEVYTSTIERDRSLRDTVVDTVAANISLLNQERWQRVAKSTEFGFDLLMKLKAERQADGR